MGEGFPPPSWAPRRCGALSIVWCKPCAEVSYWCNFAPAFGLKHLVRTTPGTFRDTSLPHTLGTCEAGSYALGLPSLTHGKVGRSAGGGRGQAEREQTHEGHASDTSRGLRPACPAPAGQTRGHGALACRGVGTLLPPRDRILALFGFSPAPVPLPCPRGSRLCF